MADPARAQAERAARELADALRRRLTIRTDVAVNDDLAVVVTIPLAIDARDLASWIERGGDECDGPHLDWL
jgi:hypothetical protein